MPKVGLARRVNPPSITLEEKARFPSSGGLRWYETSPIHDNPITLSGGSSAPPPPPHPLFVDQTENNFFGDRSFPSTPQRSGSATDFEWQICPYTCPWFDHLCCLNTKRNIEMQASKFSCWLPPVFFLQALF